MSNDDDGPDDDDEDDDKADMMAKMITHGMDSTDMKSKF